MAIPGTVKMMVESSLISYCEQRVPPHARDKARLGYRFRGNSVTLYESRLAFGRLDEWVDIVVAQFRFDAKKRTWTLYCPDHNSRWHEDIDSDPSEDFEALLQEVHEDPTGIFWG